MRTQIRKHGSYGVSHSFINTPNWASSTDFMTVTYRDWVQDIETWPQCVRANPSPCR